MMVRQVFLIKNNDYFQFCQEKKEIPRPHTIQSFSELTLDFLMTSAIAELNFHLLFQSTNKPIRNIIGEAPRRVQDLIPVAKMLMTKTMGQDWWKHADEIVKTERLSVHGFSAESDNDVFSMQILDHCSGITKFIFESHMRQMVDPMMSKISMMIFKELDFIPTFTTEMLMTVSGIQIKLVKDRKHNHFLLNLKDLSEEVRIMDLKKNNLKYDVVYEAITSLIKFGDVLPTKNCNLPPAVEYNSV